MTGGKTLKRAPVLDPIERVSEVVFGVLMALTFTGSLSVANAGQNEIRTMMLAALGCNLAWGLTDAVMYLVRAATERYRQVTLLHRLQATRDADEAHQLIASALPERLGAGAGPETLEALRKRLVATPPRSAGLGAQDYSGALGVFALVVLATFPVVIPFLFIGETALALRISNALALATLFAGGCAIARYAGANPWHWGFGMAGTGVALVAIMIALGG